ncbi:MAG: DNA repair protein RecO [Acetatifactor sp.]|nr:DNA repair protein RecO [Acetatifactor sp.]
MQQFTWVTGMVLKQTPIGEYDRRICLLTKENGKISAFARGARRPGNALQASTIPFTFGKFKLFAGRDSYSIAEADIENYFSELKTDYIGAYYGMYFCEIADYYTRENNDDREMLKLLYQSFRALCSSAIPNELVQAVFELKAIAVNGEYPGPPTDRVLEDSTIYAMNYIATSPVEKLYTFTVKDSVLRQLRQVAEEYRRHFMDRDFKSLEILKTL